MRAACAGAVRRHRAISVGFLALFLIAITSHAQTDPLPSWNDGTAKQRIVEFVRTTTTPSSPTFVPPEARIATFDQDGTLWVEHPIYTQVAYCLDRVPAVVAKKPDKAEGIHFMIGRRPYAAFGNSTGDQQMLEYTQRWRWPPTADAGAPRRQRS